LGRQLPTETQIIKLDMPLSFETIITTP
jgi:hypothetical protein